MLSITFHEYMATTFKRELYLKQLDYWNTELLKVAMTNAKKQGFVPDDPVLAVGSFTFQGRKISPIDINWIEHGAEFQYCPSTAAEQFCYPLSEEDTELSVQAEKIVREQDDLLREKYEAARFISALSMVDYSKSMLEKALGDTLFSLIQSQAENLPAEVDAEEEQNFFAFTKKHHDVIADMNQRMFFNLITFEP